MPELPEVETMRRGIGRIVGGRIRAVRFPRSTRRPLAIAPRPALLAERLVGARIGTIDRHGKRIAIGVEPAGSTGITRWLVIEPRMTGLLLLVPPPTTDHLRMEIDVGDGPRHRLRFWDQRGLGTIRLVDAAGLERACGRAKLGADGLGVTAADLDSALRASRRAIKVALLDQRVVAGIGNIYAAEILHRAGLDPRTPCRRLTTDDWQAVAAAAREILAAAVDHEGSSIGDELYRTADDRKGSYQRLHRVYGLAGTPCRRCGTPIERIVQAQRSTFFCPVCQPRRRRGAPARRPR